MFIQRTLLMLVRGVTDCSAGPAGEHGWLLPCIHPIWKWTVATYRTGVSGCRPFCDSPEHTDGQPTPAWVSVYTWRRELESSKEMLSNSTLSRWPHRGDNCPEAFGSTHVMGTLGGPPGVHHNRQWCKHSEGCFTTTGHNCIVLANGFI